MRSRIKKLANNNALHTRTRTNGLRQAPMSNYCPELTDSSCDCECQRSPRPDMGRMLVQVLLPPPVQCWKKTPALLPAQLRVGGREVLCPPSTRGIKRPCALRPHQRLNA